MYTGIHISMEIPDEEVKLGIYVILDEGESGVRGLRFQMKWAIYRKLRKSIHGRYIFARQPGNNETDEDLVNRPLLAAIPSTILCSN